MLEKTQYHFKVKAKSSKYKDTEFVKAFRGVQAARRFAKDFIVENFHMYDEIKAWPMPTTSPMPDVHYFAYRVGRMRKVQLMSLHVNTEPARLVPFPGRTGWGPR